MLYKEGHIKFTKFVEMAAKTSILSSNGAYFTRMKLLVLLLMLFNDSIREDTHKKKWHKGRHT